MRPTMVVRRVRWGAVEWYAASLAVTAAVLAVVSLQTGSRSAPVWALASLGAVAAFAESNSVQIGSYTQTSISVLPILFSAVVYGPRAAMIVAACALLPDLGRPYTRWLIWTTSRVCVAGIAGLVAAMFLRTDDSFTRLIVAVAAASLTEAFADACVTSVTVSLRHRGTFLQTVRTLGRLVFATTPLYTPVIAVLAFAYNELSPWTVLLFFAPAIAAQRLLTLYQEQRLLTQELQNANIQLERANLSFASGLVAALDARDRYTAGHSAAVAVYARDIAAALGLSEHHQQQAHLCGLLHDIGKVGLPAGILENSGSLSNSERRKMEQHVVIGEEILSNISGYADIAKIVRHHHERVDGTGYPDGLRGEQIPLLARVIAVADAYNAMTSGRPYRDAVASELARVRLADGSDAQFDRNVVAAFESILADAGETYSSGERADFALEAQRQSALRPTVLVPAA